jgi:2'-5' RNA ligase
MRLFTAIDLPAEMLDKLGEFLARLKPLAKLRWSAVGNLHITTKFIGEWPESGIGEMRTALGAVTRSGPIEIAVRGVGWFPDLKKPRVFWAGVDGGESLHELAEATDRAVSRLGVAAEDRKYSPHLTLARVKEPVALHELLKAAGEPDFGRFQASSFFLYLSANGTYSKLAEFSLTS